MKIQHQDWETTNSIISKTTKNMSIATENMQKKLDQFILEASGLIQDHQKFLESEFSVTSDDVTVNSSLKNTTNSVVFDDKLQKEKGLLDEHINEWNSIIDEQIELLTSNSPQLNEQEKHSSGKFQD